MSEADEMFEELGYRKLNKKEIQEIFKEIYADIQCCYRKPIQTLVIFYKDKTFDIISSKNMQELQAINEKVKELGWDE